MKCNMTKIKQNYQPRSLADFLPDEKVDKYGYVWKKERRKHTLELVGYDEDKEMGAIVIAHEDSDEGK